MDGLAYRLAPDPNGRAGDGVRLEWLAGSISAMLMIFSGSSKRISAMAAPGSCRQPKSSGGDCLPRVHASSKRLSSVHARPASANQP